MSARGALGVLPRTTYECSGASAGRAAARSGIVPRNLAVLVICVTLPACTGYRLVRDGQLNTSAAEGVKRKLVSVRGLGFEQPVPVQAVNATEARAMLERELHQRFQPGELAKLGRIYSALGLLPPDTDLEQAFLALYSSQVAGFYDPVDRRMVLVEDALGGDPLTRVVQGVLRRDLTGELVLAHELAHALQDQHFGLDIGHGDIGEDDAQLARRAVYEGDATLAGFGVVLGGLKARGATSLARKLARVPGQLARAYPDIPALLRETLTFQYVAGVNFVSWAYTRAGWEGVNALLTRPPLSTEQVLHPEKYFVRAEYPVAVRIGAMTPYLTEGWELSEENTLGEFIIQILGERFFARDRAAGVAAGWDGDRFMAFTRGKELSLVWLTAWDSEQDAGEFFTAYGEILAARNEGAPPERRSENLLVGAGSQPYHLERQGAKVLALEGTLEKDLAELAERVWRRSNFQPTMPWLRLEMARSAN